MEAFHLLASLQNERRYHEGYCRRIAINGHTQIWTLCVTSILIVPNMLSVLFYQCAIPSMLITVGRQDEHTGTIVVNLLWGS